MATPCANCGDCDPFPMTLPDPLSPGEWIHPGGCPLAAQLERLGALGEDAAALDAANDIDAIVASAPAGGAGGGGGDPRKARGTNKERKNLQDLYETDE